MTLHQLRLPMPRAQDPAFSLLNELPVDLQLYLLSFMWIKSVTKSLARVNRYWNHLIDGYVRNRILYHVKEGAANGATDPGRWFNVQLLVSALEPIALPHWPPC